MSKITDDDLTRSGIGCFTAVPIAYGNMGIKGLTLTVFRGMKTDSGEVNSLKFSCD